MPSYEPTPRRFSIISVSRSASRRNSIDDPGHQSLARDSLGLQDSRPVDLANVLRHLQHVGPEDEEERGRTRQSGGDNAMRATWGHDKTVTAPAAKRESSASTRERIALWEERSRSLSKGRSKSRRRDTGSRNRISVVPEVPELSTAFAAFESQRTTTTPEGANEAISEPFEMLKDAEHDTEQIAMAQEEERNTPKGTFDAVAGAEQANPWLEPHSPDPERSKTGYDGVNIAVDGHPDEKKMEQLESVSSERPQTPACQTREQPLTPETTPPPSPTRLETIAIVSGHGNYDPAREEKFRKGPRLASELRSPPTPPPGLGSNSSPGTSLPLTPQATPEQTRKRHEREVHESYQHREQHFQSDPVDGHTAAFESAEDEQSLRAEVITATQPQAQYHLPSGLLYDESNSQRLDRSAGPAIRTTQRPSVAPPQQDRTAAHEEPLYHNVWRINPYQPDFPLPDRPPNYAAIQDLGQAQFVGNPLQELPRGQLPAEPRSHNDSALASYPYTRPTDSGGGDWVVNIPPSPSAAYAPGEQRAHPARSRSRSRARTERYISGSEMRRHEWDAPPVIERALHAASVSMIQGLTVPVEVYRGLRDIYYPAPGRPNIIKAYPVRRRLPVR